MKNTALLAVSRRASSESRDLRRDALPDFVEGPMPRIFFRGLLGERLDHDVDRGEVLTQVRFHDQDKFGRWAGADESRGGARLFD